jgi:hypothetical protein
MDHQIAWLNVFWSANSRYLKIIRTEESYRVLKSTLLATPRWFRHNVKPSTYPRVANWLSNPIDFLNPKNFPCYTSTTSSCTFSTKKTILTHTSHLARFRPASYSLDIGCCTFQESHRTRSHLQFWVPLQTYTIWPLLGFHTICSCTIGIPYMLDDTYSCNVRKK